MNNNKLINQNPSTNKKIAEDVMSKNLHTMYDMITEAQSTISDSIGCTKEELEALYCIGYNFYNAAEYDKALNLFGILCVLDMNNFVYWKAFAETLKVKEIFHQAITAYNITNILHPNDIDILVSIYECYLRLQNIEAAEKVLEIILTLPTPSKGNAQYTHTVLLKEKAHLMLDEMKMMKKK